MRNRLSDDASSILLRGYGAGPEIWDRVRSDARAAPMRLLGHDAMFVRGTEGVRVFYDDDLIARHGAMPRFVQETLFGHGSVHSLDGRDHRHRKATFVDVAYRDDQVDRLRPELEREWHDELASWVSGGTLSSYDAAVGAFGRAAMRWAGLPGTSAAQTRWARRLAQIVDGFGRPWTPAFPAAVLNRLHSDRHTTRLVRAVRTGQLAPPSYTALHHWSWHRDRDGRLLTPHLAGVELQNSIRPMVAVARFVAFAAKELHDHPEWRTRIHAETVDRGALTEGPIARAFAQEVRRTAPFVPMLPGRAVRDVDFDGQHVSTGGRVVIDILGTDHDAQFWHDPDRFRPERFLEHPDYEQLDAFIPHGGADVAQGHRCPGEKLAILGLSAAVAALSDPRIEILGTGLDVNRRRLPARPASGGCVHAVVQENRSTS